MKREVEGLSIRPMKMEDVGQIAELEKICFTRPWSKDALRESLLKEEYLFLVAKIDGVIAGYVGMVCAIDEGDITEAAVFPEFRRQGVGEAILCGLFDRARERGLSRIFLEVRESNAPARAMYEKMGFRIIGIRKNFYEAPRENGLLMSRELGS